MKLDMPLHSNPSILLKVFTQKKKKTDDHKGTWTEILVVYSQ